MSLTESRVAYENLQFAGPLGSEDARRTHDASLFYSNVNLCGNSPIKNGLIKRLIDESVRDKYLEYRVEQPMNYILSFAAIMRPVSVQQMILDLDPAQYVDEMYKASTNEYIIEQIVNVLIKSNIITQDQYYNIGNAEPIPRLTLLSGICGTYGVKRIGAALLEYIISQETQSGNSIVLWCNDCLETKLMNWYQSFGFMKFAINDAGYLLILPYAMQTHVEPARRSCVIS